MAHPSGPSMYPTTSTSFPTAPTPIQPLDPLTALTRALSLPPPEQHALLTSLRSQLESQPAHIPILTGTLIKTVSPTSGDSVLKRWILELLWFGVTKSALAQEVKVQLASQCIDSLAALVQDPTPHVAKTVIATITAMYPLLFRMLCTSRHPQYRPLWDTLSRAKTSILELVWAPNTPTGIRVVALKFLQKVILVQTRGVSDPRLQTKSDPNLAILPTDHPFMSGGALEAESTKLIEGVITLLYTSNNPDILTALLASCAPLAKMRPAQTQLIISALASWTPQALITAGASHGNIRSVEKAVRVLMVHLSKNAQAAPYASQISDFLSLQASRMEAALSAERQRKSALAAEANRKRTISTLTEEASEAKRIKTTHPNQEISSMLATFDFTSLPATLVAELIVANLGALDEATLTTAVQKYRRSKQPQASASTSATGPSTSTPDRSPEKQAQSTRDGTPTPVPEPKIVKEEPIDPLKMDIDDEDIEFDQARINQDLSGSSRQGIESGVDGNDEELDFELDAAFLADFSIPALHDLPEDTVSTLARTALMRIRDTSSEFVDAGGGALTENKGLSRGADPHDLWMYLVIRLITRGASTSQPDHADAELDGEAGKNIVALRVKDRERSEIQRQMLCDWIVADFPARVRLAIAWMNEEWYNDKLQSEGEGNSSYAKSYPIWLHKLVSLYEPLVDAKDRTFSRFLVDIPHVPDDVMEMLRELCCEPERMQLGFTTLREFAVQRPPLREASVKILLDLTTHPEKVSRGAAILTVKRWLADVQPFSEMVMRFAGSLLRRLRWKGSGKAGKTKEGLSNNSEVDGMDIVEEDVNGRDSKSPGEEGGQRKESADGDDMQAEMEDGEMEDDEPVPIVQTPYLPQEFEYPATQEVVLQHVELVLALCTKVPEFLDEIFETYPYTHPSTQDALRQLVTPLIKSLGPNHSRLLSILRSFPPGAEGLALRVLRIFTLDAGKNPSEAGRATPALVNVVKEVVAERASMWEVASGKEGKEGGGVWGAEFLVCVVGEMEKADILTHLPRIVSLLNGSAENKALVKSVFESIVTTPPQTFGSVTSNLPRSRHGDNEKDLLSPAELMVLLHESEREIGLKSAIEAIGICFSMTDVFRSEILAVVMQQIVDEPHLPTLFLRTVIQAVTTYKSLVGFVSTTLLSRLITKKIWTNPPLWEGFIRCAKAIAPASFNALLQLPKDQLRELVDKQPGLKSGLREYVVRKAGGRARQMGFLEIFGEDTAPTAGAGLNSGPGGSTPEAVGSPGGTAPSTPPPGSPAPTQPQLQPVEAA